MTPEEKEQMRAEIRAEVLKELLDENAGWELVKVALKPYLRGMDYWSSTQTTSAVSSIIRHAYGLKHVRLLDPDSASDCVSLVKFIGEWMDERRVRKAAK